MPFLLLGEPPPEGARAGDPALQLAAEEAARAIPLQPKSHARLHVELRAMRHEMGQRRQCGVEGTGEQQNAQASGPGDEPAPLELLAVAPL